jgi:hypothetical protein
MIRKYAVVLIRTIHFALGASLGTFSMFWFTSEIRDFIPGNRNLCDP